MKVIKIKHETIYEIRDVSVDKIKKQHRYGEDYGLLCGGLTLADAKKLLPIYKAFFGADKDVVRIVRKEVEIVETIKTSYKEEYIEYFGELQEMGNLI